MSKKRTLSRREVLEGAAAAAGGAALLAQAGTALGQAPAVATRRRFKAWISRGEGPGRTTLHDATLRPISGRQVVVRTEATSLCYTLVPAVLGLAPPPLAAPQAAPVAGALAGRCAARVATKSVTTARADASGRANAVMCGQGRRPSLREYELAARVRGDSSGLFARSQYRLPRGRICSVGIKAETYRAV